MSVITSFLEIMYRGGTLLDVLMNVISTCTFACYSGMDLQAEAHPSGHVRLSGRNDLLCAEHDALELHRDADLLRHAP